jgi:hypothetical protein
VAFCEGDDFWHNPNKLQKHYDFLINRPSHSLVYSDFGRLQKLNGCDYWVENTIDLNVLNGYTPTTIDLLKDIHIHLSTIMAKTSVVKKYLRSNYFNPNLKLGDVPMFLFLSLHGEVEYFKFSASTYRINPNSITNINKLSRLSVVMDHVKVCKYHWRDLTSRQLKELEFINKKRLFDAALFALNPSIAIKSINWLSPTQIMKFFVLLVTPSVLEKKWVKALQNQRLSFMVEAAKY